MPDLPPQVVQSPSEGKPASKPVPSPAQIKSLYDAGVQRRYEADREAWENIAFIAGKQYVVWDSNARRFRRPSDEDGRARLRINLVKALWRGELATLQEANPEPEVLPSSDSEMDKVAATISNQILDHELRRLRQPLIRLDLDHWVTSAGLGYVHPTWDKDANEVRIEVCPQFEIVVDPAVRRDVSEGMWIIHSRNMTVEEAYERFGKEFPAEPGADVYDWGNMFAGSLFQEKKADACQVLRMWHKPSRRYPKGFVRTIVSGAVVEDIPFPYKHGELPFIDFHHIRLPGRYEGQAMIHDLLAPQRDYNQSRSRVAEIRALMSAPGWMAPEGSLDTERMTTEPGQVITYRVVGPYKPEQLQPPQAPAHLFQTLQQAWTEMQDIAGQHDVSRGASPTSGTAASAIVALQEKDQRKLATTIRSAEIQWARTCKQILELIQQYWNTQRMVRVWSEEEGASAVYFYKGSDLRNQTDVHIVPGSSEPKSKAQEQELLLSMWRERLIADPNPVLERMGIPGMRKYIQKTNLDLSQARREHDRIFDGEEVLPELWHNHDVHIQEHNEFRKGELFEAWPQPLKNVIADHIAQHEQLREQQFQEELQKQLEQQAMMGLSPEGVPAEGSTPPQETM